MNQRIIYKNNNGSVSVIVPVANSGLTVQQIAAKDVPTGKLYKIVDAADIPNDRSQRDLWTVDDANLNDGVGVGNYTVNFAIPRSNTNYAAVVTANRTGTWADGKQNVSTKTVNSVLVQHVEGAAFVLSEYFAKGEKL